MVLLLIITTCLIFIADDCQANYGNCDHKCEATVEGYKCTCFDGYALVSDERTCSGK